MQSDYNPEKSAQRIVATACDVFPEAGINYNIGCFIADSIAREIRRAMEYQAELSLSQSQNDTQSSDLNDTAKNGQNAQNFSKLFWLGGWGF